MDKPDRVKNCVTHSYACDCREWHFGELEKKISLLEEKCRILEGDARKWKFEELDRCADIDKKLKEIE